MAEAYATFGARGIHCDSLPVTSVSDADGNLVKDYPQTCEQVMPGATADAVNDVLRGVMEPGGFGQNIAIDKPSAGKTGTNNANMAVWFAGYTPEIAAAAMVAGADPLGNWVTLNGQVVGGSYISEAFGSTVAGPIWGDAMAAVSAQARLHRLHHPVRRPDRRRPHRGARGQRDDAGGRHRGARGGGLRRQRRRRRSTPRWRAGLVAYTSPGGGTSLSSGDTVVIYPSTGYVPPPPEPEGNGGGNGGGGGGGNGNGPAATTATATGTATATADPPAAGRVSRAGGVPPRRPRHRRRGP